MTEASQPLPQEAALALYREATKRLDRRHTNIRDVTEMLVQGGMEKQQAADMVTGILEGIRKRNAEEERAARKDILIGSIILVAGVLITAVSYYNAAGKGSYVITWGAMMVGVVRLFKGISNS